MFKQNLKNRSGKIKRKGEKMPINNITIKGLRGFTNETKIHFAVPDKENIGSGLTVLVGPNNSGKSTLIEAIHLLSVNKDTIPITARNSKTNGYVYIKAEDTSGNQVSLESTQNAGAFIQRKFNGEIQEYGDNRLNTFILTSKRGFSSTFNNSSSQSRRDYIGNIGSEEYRNESNVNYNFGGRLINIYKNKSEFNNCLNKVLSPLPKWTIESLTGSNLYLEFTFDEIKHNSNGAGDGYINIFNIVDSLYDATENSVILIDEPEISLHPDLQRKLFKLLVEYSKDRQIIISTHSPYFVDWNVFSSKGKIIRFKKEEDTIYTYELRENTKREIKELLKDKNNPHILDLNANEIFFLNDNVILTEGQEDVICYKEIFRQYNFESNASFFGWGAGGAPKIKIILNILYELGYKRVFTILDNDKRSLIPELQKIFPLYNFYAIVTDDVRNKKDDKLNKIIHKIELMDFDELPKKEIINLLKEKAKNAEGLVLDKKDFEINEKYRSDIQNLIIKIKEYFNNKCDKVEFDKNTENKDDEIDNTKKDEEIKVEKMLNEYIEKNRMREYIKNKYCYLKFTGGSGGTVSSKKIRKHIYYVVIEQTEIVSINCSIIIDFHYIVNTKKEKVKLVRKKVVSNSLPKKYKIIGN